MTQTKKLIEVSLPLDAINRAAAREKSIRHGHPSTLHLWWARRPLAAARAVIFAQMVDDPSSVPEEFPTEADQQKERDRLFKLIEELVLWKNTTNEEVLERTRAEIRRSWARTCKETGENPDVLPPFLDPFAGGGALPLEAQRLGLESHASDLNPVAVLINKAMIEIPPRFFGQPPVNPEAQLQLGIHSWRGAQGLAADVRYYGQWMRDRAHEQIGRLYPDVTVTENMAASRDDLTPHRGQDLKVISWIWARTVRSPNPAFSNVDVPLISTYVLSSKKGQEAWLEPTVEGESYRFEVRTGLFPGWAKEGTKLGRGASFKCILSDAPMGADYIRAEGQAGRMGAKLVAIVCSADRRRVYMPATNEQEDVARSAKPDWEPEGGFVQDSRAFTPWLYGMSNWRDLFTNRQLVALTTFSELISEARQRVLRDTDSIDGDTRDADDYANAVALYLSLGVSRLADIQNALCAWENSKTQVRHLFTRQAIPMLWDYGENGLFSGAAGDFGISLKSIVRCMERWTLELPQGTAEQADAQIQSVDCGCVISTDPPYYDNIGYADLSDFFYVWLRKSLRHIYPDVFSTVTTPKAEELISAPYRHGGRMEAEQFFLHGMKNAVARMLHNSHALIPVTIYYAFKQSEKAQDGLTSTGWATFLEAVISSGFSITGTWPMRSELANRMRGLNSNALASSVVIVCRPRSSDAPSAPRRDFLRELRKRLPGAVEKLQHANIAPVDLAQAALGPGMAVFSEYSSVVEPEGGEMSVREALRVINNVLAETLEGQETDFDSDTRWAVAWFKQNGFAQGEYGMAEELARAQAVSVDGLKNGGIVKSGSGKARLVRLEELPENWDPTTDDRVSIWECTSHLAQSLKEAGEAGCAMVLRQVRQKSATLPEASRELAYLLFQVCEKNGWTAEALAYNALVVAWPSIENQADALAPEPEQAMLL